MQCARNLAFVVLAFATLSRAQAGNQLVRINEVLAGLNTAASDFSLTATSSNGSVITSAAIKLGGTGAERTLTLTPQTGATGVTTIATVAAQGGQTIKQTFQVTVLPFVVTLTADAPANSLTFTFSTQPGQRFLIEKSAEVTAASWQTENTVIATQKSVATALAPDRATQLFYRVRAAP